MHNVGHCNFLNFFSLLKIVCILFQFYLSWLISVHFYDTIFSFDTILEPLSRATVEVPFLSLLWFNSQIRLYYSFYYSCFIFLWRSITIFTLPHRDVFLSSIAEFNYGDVSCWRLTFVLLLFICLVYWLTYHPYQWLRDSCPHCLSLFWSRSASILTSARSPWSLVMLGSVFVGCGKVWPVPVSKLLPFDVLISLSGTEDVGASHQVSWMALFAAFVLLDS